MIVPRYYQAEALDAIYSYFVNGGTGNPLIGLPTGTGKSLIPALFIQAILKKWPNQRFLMITSVKELIDQNANELLSVWPEAPLGIYSAGLKLKQSAQPIVFGGIQSMIKNPQLFGHRDVVFIDEAHLISAEESSQYQTFLGFMKLINPNLKVIGMSATLFRMSMGLITANGIFTDIVYDKTTLEGFNELLAAGYMAPLIPLRTQTELDVSDVSVRQGEFVPTQLQGAVDKAPITFKALQEAVHAGQNRKSWLIFASGIEHAEHIAEQLGAFGIDCAPVHSKRPAEYNDAAIKAFKNGELRAIANYGKLTTGFNHPEIDLILMLRPTLSVPLWVQMLGRGTRPAKENCIAEGSLVLTDGGLIPIEKVSLTNKVWDGVEFVSHTGLIYQGYKEVIEYEGLQATSDHNVWTRRGWKTFKETSDKKIGIAITGIGRKHIQQSKNYFSRNSTEKENLYKSRMPNLLRAIVQRIYKCTSSQSWLSQVWQSKANSRLAFKSLYSCENALYEYRGCSLFGLWRTRNKIQLFNSYGNGSMDTNQSWFAQTFRNRSQGKQWALRTGKLEVVNQSRKHDQSKIVKKHVFDISNAGRHHRFTVNGLLVSNCLVMDFARNTPRLGPINDPQIPKPKGTAPGEIPIKICEHCGTYNHISARICCNCSEQFSFQVKLVSKAGTDELIRAAVVEPTPIVETFNVLNATYVKHDGKNGKPPTLKATYYTTGLAFNEYVCLEHSGMAGKIGRDWWRRRSILEPPPTVDEALHHLSNLRCPRFIRVHVNKSFPEILSCEF